MVVSAEKARERAEARRLRILSKANERLDVVSGLVPSSEVDGGTKVTETEEASPRGGDGGGEEGAAANNKQSDEKENKGSKRMAAMRRRRAQQRAAAKEDDAVESKEGSADAGDAAAAAVVTTADVQIDGTNADESATAASAAAASESKEVDDGAAPTPSENQTTNNDTGSTVIQKSSNNNTLSSSHQDPSSSSSNNNDNTNNDDEPKKSYLGVAKMRRRILAQQKADRLASISDSEAFATTDVPLERELAAEMSVMGITAKMVREGGDVCDGSVLGGVVTSGGNTGRSTKGKGRWRMPPMFLVSRMITLFFLFGTGLRLGMETHSLSNQSPTSGSSSSDSTTTKRNVHRVETVLTKPWERGFGGKVAYMVGRMPSSPPSAFPTGFYEDACLASYEDQECKSNTASDTTEQSKKQMDRHHKKKDHNKINMIDMEDEFDTGRARPRGVSVSTDEFDETITAKEPNNNIDPLFRADLDDLLIKSALPFPIYHAAKFAIGFHRLWIHILWTLPSSALKRIGSMPGRLLGGWIRYPPVVLIFTLLIRAGNKVLLGGGKKLEEEGGKDANNSKGGLDVMKKVMDSARNYVEGKFPWLVFVLGTLLDVVKVDMYVVFCGLLVGLVVPLQGPSLGFGGGKVLGDGEL